MLKGKWESKYVNWGITILCVVCTAIAFFFLLLKLDAVMDSIRFLLKITTPIIYGLVLCYIMRPVYSRIEQRLYSVCKDDFRRVGSMKKFVRVASTTMSLLLLVGVIYILIELILPQIIATVSTIIDSTPENLQRLSKWLETVLADNPTWEKPVMYVVTEVTTGMQQWVQTGILPQITSIVANVSMGLINVFTALLDLIVGIIVFVYVLSNKERFCSQGKKLCYAFLPEAQASKLIRGVRFADRIYSGFIGGKLLDSLIIGCICFVSLYLMGMPYVVLISVIVGVTNIVPFFGPFIGAIPSALLILLVNPMQCLYFIIFILLLQQIDGNIIGPKILGESTGLSSFWVIFAILLGGGLFGFIGMVLGVPTFAVFYYFIKYVAEKRLGKRNLPVATEDYNNGNLSLDDRQE